ncbi:MAG: AAA family ATPase [Lewinellaceae bacterium]|nr:AAA family ATPase [Lewinellaceae bacterium]
MASPLSPTKLRKTYDPASLNLEKLSQISSPKAIIGQERAVRALQFGLGNKSAGFNVYISGYEGEGKIDAVLHFLRDLAHDETVPNDWCYVNNFEDTYCPKRLSLAKGQARVFKTDIQNFVDEAYTALLRAFESEEYASKREELNRYYQEQEKELFANLDKRAREEKFFIKRTPVEVISVPLVDGKPMTDRDFIALSEEDRAEILKKQESFKDELKVIARRAREMEKEFAKTIFELDQKVALFSIETLLEELLETYKNQQGVVDYLRAIKENILENLPEFIQSGNSTKVKERNNNTFRKQYEVNIIVDNSHLKGAPIILELNPTYNNLFGKIEKESNMGALVTDFTLIRSGSLHTANGGYIVIPVDDLLRNPFSWESLKRSLRNREIVPEDAIERLGYMSTKSLKPEPIPLNLQVILIGRPEYYYLLYELDDDFKELFKVKADFTAYMPNSEDNIRDFCGFVTNLCQEEGTLQLSAAGMATLLEHAHRLADHQDRLSTQFGQIADVIIEANHYAKKENEKAITSSHLQQAIRERFFRSNLMQERILEFLKEGVYLLDVEGDKVGQVNGLAVLQMGDISFGRPSRITASISVGNAGIVDIEREAKLGGPLHTKGVLILSGFLAETFGSDKSLSLQARLVFEQSYGGIDGDSASSTELYALLSALSNIPIHQGIAVTGSVNQKGEVQAIGGVNEKIEGFFDVCKLKGLTGKQGVMIPASNVNNLMLKEEVVEAVKNGQFSIWAVHSIQEGFEVLTGVHTGSPMVHPQTGEVTFEAGTAFDKVNKRLVELGEKLTPPSSQ